MEIEQLRCLKYKQQNDKQMSYIIRLNIFINNKKGSMRFKKKESESDCESEKDEQWQPTNTKKKT